MLIKICTSLQSHKLKNESSDPRNLHDLLQQITLVCVRHALLVQNWIHGIERVMTSNSSPKNRNY